MNSSVRTTTVFQITGGVIARMTAAIILMKKTAVSEVPNNLARLTAHSISKMAIFILAKAKFGLLCPEAHISVHIFTFRQNIQNKLT